MISATIDSMVILLLVFLARRALGCYVTDRRYGIYSRLILLCCRLSPPCATIVPMRNAPSWQVSCFMVGGMISLLVVGWEFIRLEAGRGAAYFVCDFLLRQRWRVTWINNIIVVSTTIAGKEMVGLLLASRSGYIRFSRGIIILSSQSPHGGISCA